MKRTICQLLLLIAVAQVPAEAQQYEAVDGMGNLFIPDSYTGLIHEVFPNGIITTAADLSHDSVSTLTVAVDGAGGLFIADAASPVFKISPSGMITWLTVPSLYEPAGVATDGANNLYIADAEYSDSEPDSRPSLYKVSPYGTVTLVAGGGPYGHSDDDGPAANLELNQLTGMAVDGAGNIYFTDSGTVRILRPATALSGTAVMTVPRQPRN
jgi:sugar lactone lactonase YvrE